MMMSSTSSSEQVRPLVFCGPSGVGKGTLLARLLADYPKYFAKTVSHTSRPARQGETNGKSYNFVSKDDFERDIAAGKFIEYARIHNNLYGTSVDTVESISSSGRICILEIDVQGAEIVRNKTKLNPFYFFILPPTFQSLKDRLLKRGTESAEVIATRLETAQRELKFIEENNWFDVKIVNDDLDKSYIMLKEAIFTLYPKIKKHIDADDKHKQLHCQKNDSPHCVNGSTHTANGHASHENGHCHKH